MKVENKLIIKRMPWHANMTERNHLGKALIIKPQVFEPKVTQIFTSQQYSDNPLSSILVNEGRMETIESREWEWSLRGATTRPLVALEKIEPSAQPGRMKSTFLLKLDENWFKPGDILHPGTSNKKNQVRVQEMPFKHGVGWAYRCRLMSDDPASFLDPKYLANGQQWAKLFSQYEEAGSQAGSTQYSLPIAFSNHMSRYKKEYEVTGDVYNEVLAVAIPDSKGKYHNSWIKYAEVEYWQQWYKEQERAKWYSRSTDTVLGDNGRPIYSGPGIHEMLEDSHVHRYSHLSARLIEEYLMDIFYGRVKPGADRQIKGFTGEYGMIQFHRAIQAWNQKNGFIQIVDTNFIQKTNSPYNTNALVAGYQFVKYRMANGAELELVHNPIYDDREINFEIDPLTGFPVESQRITFLDFSGQGKSSNIKFFKKKGGYKLGYVAGLTTPYGPVNGDLMSHSGDHYTMIVNDEQGVHIEDVTRCGELILDRN